MIPPAIPRYLKLRTTRFPSSPTRRSSNLLARYGPVPSLRPDRGLDAIDAIDAIDAFSINGQDRSRLRSHLWRLRTVSLRELRRDLTSDVYPPPSPNRQSPAAAIVSEPTPRIRGHQRSLPTGNTPGNGGMRTDASHPPPLNRCRQGESTTMRSMSD